MRLKAWLILSIGFLAPAQTQAPAVFEVASVKASRSHSLTGGGRKGADAVDTPVLEADHLTFRARSVSLFALIVEAYGLKFCRPFADSCPMVSGGPAWLAKDVFDVDAKAPSGATGYDTMQLRNAQAPQLQERLRNLLGRRFNLKSHFEKRELPVVAFSIAESGIRMKKANANQTPKIVFKPVNQPNGMKATEVIATNSTIQELADLYSRFMDRPVIDMTGLTDRFDFTVSYDADTDAQDPFAAVTAPTLFQAFEKQAGLKLKATRRPVSVLVIDSAARPSPN